MGTWCLVEPGSVRQSRLPATRHRPSPMLTIPSGVGGDRPLPTTAFLGSLAAYFRPPTPATVEARNGIPAFWSYVLPGSTSSASYCHTRSRWSIGLNERNFGFMLGLIFSTARGRLRRGTDCVVISRFEDIAAKLNGIHIPWNSTGVMAILVS